MGSVNMLGLYVYNVHCSDHMQPGIPNTAHACLQHLNIIGREVIIPHAAHN